MVSEVNGWFGETLIDHLGEEVNVAGRIEQRAINEASIACSTEEFLDVVELNIDYSAFSVGDSLQLDHVFELAVNGVRF